MSKYKVLDSSDLYTVGWIAALPKELAAAMGMLDERHGKPKDFKKSSSDTNSYQWGRIGDHNVVLALLPTGLYGTTPAATTAIHMLSSFPRIKVGLMVGIGAAIARPNKDRDIRLGDIVISLPKGKSGGVIQYDLGKDRMDEHQGEVTRICERTGFLNSPPEALLKALGAMIATVRMDGSRVSDFLGDMLERHPRMTKSKPGEPAYVYQGQENDRLFEASYIHVGGRGCDECDPAKMILREIREDPSEPEVHYGVIASGNRVIKDATARDEILEKSGEDCICLEMEAAGLMNSFPCLVIRGICDYADSHKNDDWQEYAAATAAACAKEFLGFVDNEDLAETPNASDILKQISSNVKISMDNVNNTALIVQGMQLDAHQSKIVHWLSASDPSVNHLKALEKRHEGTGLWFIQSQAFRDWKNQSKSFLWLHGIPGCGKTILTSTIVEHIKDNVAPDHALLYFYFDFNDFDFNDSNKQTFENLLRSFVNQLYRTQPDTRSYVDQLWKAHHKGNQSLSRQSLGTVLLAMLSKVSNFSIVLDALDEASSRSDLLTWLESLLEKEFSACRILVTARREQDIESALQLWTQPENRIDIQGDDVDRDIKAYVNHTVRKSTELERWQNRPDVQNEIELELTEKASGMFRWVACQIDALKNCLDYPRLKRALQNLPRTLDDTYTRILENVPAEHAEQTTTILHILVRSDKPFKITELVDAIAVNLNEDPGFDPKNRLPVPREVLKLCTSLIAISWDEHCSTDVVRLAHFSVKEYLASDKVSGAFKSLTNEKQARAYLARLFLTYLIAVSRMVAQVELYSPSWVFSEFPLIVHAIDDWTTYAEGVETQDEDLWKLILCFLVEDPDAFSFAAKHCFHPAKSSLVYASRSGLTRVVEYLIDESTGFGSVDVNAHHGAALAGASIEGHPTTVQLLLDRGADINAGDGAALRRASREGHHTVVELLLERGADVKAPSLLGERHQKTVQPVSDQDSERNTNAVAARSANHGCYGRIVASLRNKDAEFNARDGVLPQMALYKDHDLTVETPLNSGSYVGASTVGARNGLALRMTPHNEQDSGCKYDSALKVALMGGHVSIVQLLLEKGASLSPGDFWSTLTNEFSFLRHEVSVLLPYLTAELAAQEVRMGRNILHYAAACGSQSVVRKCLDLDVDINFRDQFGRTALHYAAAQGVLETIKLLVQAGSDVNARDEGGHTPLAYAQHDDPLSNFVDKIWLRRPCADAIEYLTQKEPERFAGCPEESTRPQEGETSFEDMQELEN